MIIKKIFFFSIILTGFFACTKNEVDHPELIITPNKTEYTLGDTVKFSFSGNPGLITFYSGEAGKKYENRNRFTAEGTPQFKFTSFRQNTDQANSLRVLVSTDFNATYNPENLALATWTDITSRAVLSTGADNTTSGDINLADFKIAGKPAYIAFKYMVTGLPAVSQPTWTIKNVAIDVKTPDGTLIPVKTIANISWSNINVSNPARAWTFSTTQLQMVGVAVNTSTTAANEAWLVSQPIVLDQVQRDVGVAIKDFTTKMVSYNYYYANKGTYKAVFEIANNNLWDSKTEFKEVLITIK